ncbi:MAG: hypothetical protein AMXMBFR7_19860 [Planctomycetota bacterium]
MWRYALTIFLSAFLLFQVQPLIGKYILPWFGGGPAVWTTCMLFFQLLLLAGYAYAHLLCARLTPRRQALLHLLVLTAAAFWLPIVPSETWKPTAGQTPEGQILLLLLATLGLPYFALSATAPLVQRWFSLAHPSASPYRLYALSNAGSLLALLSYPLAVEPHLRLRDQAWVWSLGFGAYALGAAACAWSVYKLESAKAAVTAETEAPRPSYRTVLLWLGLSGFPSLLLLAVTNQITQEVAPVPFLWVLPLCLYLLTFVIAFDRPSWYLRGPSAGLLLAAVLGTCFALSQGVNLSLPWQVASYSALLFFGALCCHGELVRSRPPARHLTLFYLAVSAGGAMGGAFVALAAPRLFHSYTELSIGVLGCAILTFLACLSEWRPPGAKRPTLWIVWAPPLLFCGPLAAILVLNTREHASVVESTRNFYGVLKVLQESDENGAYLSLRHGRINHGMQYQDELLREQPTTYYVERAGAGLTLKRHPKRQALGGGDGSLRFAVIGLGTGTLATYAQPGDTLRFYEINPEVIRLAQARFTYCADTKADVEFVLGDARVMMEQELLEGRPQRLDALAVDAFTSDAIPMHLLTQECFDLYWKHLEPDGVLAVHVSNRYLDLKPLVFTMAHARGFKCVYVDYDQIDAPGADESSWMLVTRNRAFLDLEEIAVHASKLTEASKPLVWTDDYGSLLHVLKK